MNFKNMKIKVENNLEDIVESLKSKGIGCCSYSFDGKVRVIYVSGIANEAYGAYKSSRDMDLLFGCELTTLAELKEM
jgi:hypothetical protein